MLVRPYNEHLTPVFFDLVARSFEGPIWVRAFSADRIEGE